MNSSYWEKTVIKLLNLTNCEYNFNNNGSKTDIKTNAFAREHVARKAGRHVSTFLARRVRNLADWFK